MTTTSAAVKLARPEPRLAPGILEYSRDLDFFRYLDARPMSTLAEAEAFLQDLARQNAVGERDYFAIIDAATETAIGTIGFLFPYGRAHRVADLGYGLSRAYWGSGAFQDACRQVLAHGFDTLDLARVQVTTRGDNARAAAAVEKVGFRREAHLHSFYQAPEGRLDGVLLYLLREHFQR